MRVAANHPKGGSWLSGDYGSNGVLKGPPRRYTATRPPRPSNLQPVDVELQPRQPEPVARVVAELLAEAPEAPDPWWQAGIDEQISEDFFANGT